MARGGPVRVDRDAGIRVTNDFVELAFSDGVVTPFPRLIPGEHESFELRIADPVLARVVEQGNAGPNLAYRATYDIFETPNVHVYLRIEAVADARIDLPELPGVVKKPWWHARWNDVGAYGHAVIGAGPLELARGETVECAYFHTTSDGGVREAAYDPLEARYVPEGEYRHSLLWECEDVWLGPPIFDGCPQRPHDQLIARPLGLDVLARKRFTWSNEDFSLWRVTGKDRYWESGVKKAYALMATQNEHGGWWEGIEFYNLPPHHHHMYDTYIAGLFLLEAYDLTRNGLFLDAAHRAKGFWLSQPPPANGHTEEAPDAWWYRWGGYVNEFGYTDERLVLNTHAGATEFLALLYERTGDGEARTGMERGVNAFKLGLERGIQKANGQFLYCLSQADPTLERPGDPPYLRLDLVPQIEDVYTVASSYRLMLANRVAQEPAIASAVRRALDYWWSGYREGRVYTYRAYAVIAFAVAAGEIDLVYALALPELLKDPDHFTSMQRGLSSFVAPAALAGLSVDTPPFVEPVFLRRREGEFMFALVNLEYPRRRVRVEVELPPSPSDPSAVLVDAATKEEAPVRITSDNRRVTLEIPELGEFGVACVRLAFSEDPGT